MEKHQKKRNQTMIEIEDRINTSHANHPNAPLATETGKALALTIHETSSNMAVPGGGGSAENHAAWHYRGCPGADQKPTQKSWHFTVDEGPIVYQSMPVEGVNGGTYTAIAWHAGDGNTPLGGNVSTVGIEICSNRGAEQFRQALDNAAQLCVTLHELGHATKSAGDGPVIKMHRDHSGKKCPLGMISDPALWDYFLSRIEHWKNAKAAPWLPETPKLEAAPPVIKPPTLPAPAPSPAPPRPRPVENKALLGELTTSSPPSLIQPTRTIKKAIPEAGATGGVGAILGIFGAAGIEINTELLIGLMVAIPPLLFAMRRLIRDARNSWRDIKDLFNG